MTDTPRTDTLLIAHDMAPTHISLINHSRELERELNAANERIKRLEEACNEILGWIPYKLTRDHATEIWNKAKEAKP